MNIILFIFKIIRNLCAFFLLAGIFIFYLWCIPAVYYLNIPYFPAWFFAIGSPAAVVFFHRKRLVLFIIFLLCLLFAMIYYLMPASNDKDWVTEMSVMPSVSFNGKLVDIRNIRDFDYKSEKEFKLRYCDRVFDINKLDSLDFILSYWGGNKKIAHTMLSFGFTDGSHIVVSVETRLEKGQSQSGLAGLYNQYGLIYILADERDILRLRTNFRKEDVYLYPLKMDKKELDALFVEIMNRVDYIGNHPQFYNTVKSNCMTSLLGDIERASGKRLHFDYRFICNGLSDKMIYDKGLFITDNMPFKLFKENHHINQYVKDGDNPDEYSKTIRRIH